MNKITKLVIQACKSDSWALELDNVYTDHFLKKPAKDVRKLSLSNILAEINQEKLAMVKNVVDEIFPAMVSANVGLEGLVQHIRNVEVTDL